MTYEKRLLDVLFLLLRNFATFRCRQDKATVDAHGYATILVSEETCSHYVYRIAKHQGFKKALRALRERNELCRPGYVVYKYMDKFHLKTAGGQIFTEESISPYILPPHNEKYLDLDSFNYECLSKLN